MTHFSEIKHAIDLTAESFDAFKSAQITRLDGVVDRLEAVEAGVSSPGKVAETRTDHEHKNLFSDWIRKPDDAGRMNKLSDFETALSKKDMTIGSGSAGGFAVPSEIAREIERLELKFSPVRRLVKTVQVGTQSYTEVVSLSDATSGWVGETGTRTATATPKLREIAPTFGELYAYPQVSEWSLDDLFFNVETWLAEEVAAQFAKQEGAAVMTGDGTNKPTGMLNTTPTTADDFASPLRAAAAYQFIVSLSDTSPPVAEIQPDSLIDLVFAVNSAYRSNSTWIMNSTTAAAVRKLKDDNGQYLWAPGLAAGQPDRLLGYPVETWEDMADIGANAFPIAFGDFRRGYVLADRVGLRITRDNVTNVGHVRFYVRRREGGMVLNNDSVKFLRTTIA